MALARTGQPTSGDYSGVATKKIDVSSLGKFLGSFPGLIHMVDPELAGPVNTSPAKFREPVRDATVRIPNGPPVLAGAGAGLNGHQVFNWSSIATTDMRIDAGGGTPASWSFVTTVQPSTASINGSRAAYLASIWDGAERAFLASAVSGTPTLVLNIASQTVAWPIEGLVGGGIYTIACTVDAVTKRAAIYVQDPVDPKVEVVLANTPTAFANGKFYVGASGNPTNRSWGGKMGRAMFFDRDISAIGGGAWLQRLFEELDAYYATT